MNPASLSSLMSLGWLPDTREALEEDTRFCHICLQEGRLSKEHVPPRSAFNDSDRLWDYLVIRGGTQTTRQANLRGGFRVRTLCRDCNRGLCAPYAKEYVRFIRDIVDAPRLLDGSGAAHLFSVRQNPLKIAKEIATMILAIEPIHFSRHNPALRAFVTDSFGTVDPPFRILAFLVPNDPRAGTILRFHARVDTFAPGYGFMGGEVSLYPFGFVYAYQIGHGYELERFTDITSWFRAGSPSGSTLLAAHVRTSGVDSLQATMGERRIRPQIDVLPSTNLIRD